MDSIPGKIKLSEYEKGFYASTPDSPRYEKIIRFATIDLVKAGWLVKNKGKWIITEEGRLAFNKYPDSEIFYKEAVKLCKDWKRSRPSKLPKETTELEVEEISLTIEEAEEKSWNETTKYLQKMNPYDFQEVVADLLRAMEYHVSWIAPPGRDRGIDIIAYTDPLGVNNPRIKVQVKRRDSPVTVEGLRAFLSVLGTEDVGIFVSTGGFTSDARDEARTQERRKVTLIDLEHLFDLWVEHYSKLSQEARQRLPLKPIYFLLPIE